MKNKISTGLGCLFLGIPLPTYIHNAFNSLQKSNGFDVFNTFYIHDIGGYMVIILLAFITIALFVIATKELCPLMMKATPCSSYRKL